MPRIHTLDTLYKLTKIDKNQCRNFIGPIDKKGYGRVGYKGLVVYAHRLSWILTYGEIVNGLCVCHKCDNCKCINPDHLFLGTHKDNTQDMIRKGRRAKSCGRKKLDYCQKGHDFKNQNPIINKIGHKTCRICHNQRVLEYYYAKKKNISNKA